MDSSNNKLSSSQWSDCFPTGLRVLAVDYDPMHLKILQNMLNKCNYQVMTCNLMGEALNLLQERRDGGFDIVISDVNVPDMDAFKLVKHVGLKMDIPVIMMSVDGETSRVMKSIQHGACDYLLKPIRMEELQNIWQHVVRKRIRDSESQKSHVSLNLMMRNGTKQSDEITTSCRKKRKDVHDRESCGDPSSSVKKARVIWTADLHQKFVQAVNQIGLDKAGPKKILDLMEVAWLTRENVASHLQKYRLSLRRLQKENELKAAAACGRVHHHPAAGNVCLQSSIRQTSVTVQQNVVTNNGKYVVPLQKIQIHNHNANVYEGNTKGILSMPITAKHSNALFGDMTYLPISTASRISFNNNHFIGPLDSDEVKESESKNKPHFQPEHHFDHHQLITMPQIQLDSVSRNPAAGLSTGGGYDDDDIGKVAIVENNKDALVSAVWRTRNHSMSQNIVYDNLESSLKNLIVGTSQGDLYPLNQDDLVSIGSFGCGNQELVADVPQPMCDSVDFECEYYPGDPLECLVIDQGPHIS